MPDSLGFSRKLVLVLGASGYIGSWVVAALASGPVYRPVAASRRSKLRLDATDPAAMAAALRDVDCVVNCIAGNEDTMVRSTRVLCDAARVSPPRRIVHLSSMAIYGAATGAVAEDHVPVAPISGYGQAKLDCEHIILKYVHDGGDAIILRPTCVFGPGSPQWTLRLARLLRARRIGDMGTAGDGCCNLTYTEDLVAAITAALDAPDVAGRAFNVGSPAAMTWNQFLIAYGRALGATPVARIAPRTLRIETRLLAPARRVAGLALRSPVTEAITPSLAALWAQDIRIDSSAAVMALALPQTSPDQMIASVVRQEHAAIAPATP